MPNPRIAPVEIGDLTLIDPDDATPLQAQQASLGYWGGFNRWIGDSDKLRPGELTLCGFDEAKRTRTLDRYLELLKTTPDLSWNDFINGGGEIELPGDWDKRLPSMLVTVLRDGKGHGSFSVTNIQIELDDPRRLEVSAVGSCITDPGNSGLMVRQWAAVIAYFLDNDIKLKDGRDLDILEWRFPYERKFRRDNVLDLSNVRTEIERIGVSRPGLSGGALWPEKMRRSDAPRQAPEDEVIPRDGSLPPRGTFTTVTMI